MTARRVSTREEVAELLEQGLSRSAVARALGLAKGTVSYHARRLGEPIDERCNRRYDWQEVQAFYDRGHSVRDCLRHFGFARATYAAAVKRGDVVSRPKGMPIEQLLAASRSRGHLKLRLLAAGLKQNRCEACGIDSWLGRPLSLALHHVNGRGEDNRLENLALLCPNCHSQTENFAGRKNRRAAEAAAATPPGPPCARRAG